MVAALVLVGCAPQTDAAKQAAPGAAVAQTQKKCAGDANTGSRLKSCNGMTSDAVAGTSGDEYRDTQRMMGSSAAKSN
jgi:hypothetical protein